jgi:hypothetical protein
MKITITIEDVEDGQITVTEDREPGEVLSYMTVPSQTNATLPYPLPNGLFQENDIGICLMLSYFCIRKIPYFKGSVLL